MYINVFIIWDRIKRQLNISLNYQNILKYKLTTAFQFAMSWLIIYTILYLRVR